MPTDTKKKIKVKFARPLYDKQRDAIFVDKRWIIVEASTKSGKTHAAIQWMITEALDKGKEGRSFWWVAPTFQQAKMSFQRCERALPNGLTMRTNSTELTLTLLNGAALRFISAYRPVSMYGDDLYGAVCDEASRCPEGSWYALRSTLSATRARCVLIGNVKGRKNWFYHLARKAEVGEPDWHYARLSAYDAVEGGVLDQEEIESARRTLPESVFNELYMAEPSDDSGNPFGHENIAACIRDISSEPSVVFGVDLARSVDWTVVTGIDAQGDVSYFDRFQADWETTERRVSAAIGHVPTFIDSTGVGDPIFERIAKVCSGAERYHFSQGSKQVLMETLSVSIQNGEIGYPEGVIVNELNDFEFVYSASGVRYAASGQSHDDAVVSLALANYKFQNQPGRGIWL